VHLKAYKFAWGFSFWVTSSPEPLQGLSLNTILFPWPTNLDPLNTCKYLEPSWLCIKHLYCIPVSYNFVVTCIGVREVPVPHFLDWGVQYLHFSGRKGEEFAVACFSRSDLRRLNHNKTVSGRSSAPDLAGRAHNALLEARPQSWMRDTSSLFSSLSSRDPSAPRSEVAKLCLSLIAETDARSVGDSHPSCCYMRIICRWYILSWPPLSPTFARWGICPLSSYGGAAHGYPHFLDQSYASGHMSFNSVVLICFAITMMCSINKP